MKRVSFEIWEGSTLLKTAEEFLIGKKEKKGKKITGPGNTTSNQEEQRGKGGKIRRPSASSRNNSQGASEGKKDGHVRGEGRKKRKGKERRTTVPNASYGVSRKREMGLTEKRGRSTSHTVPSNGGEKKGGKKGIVSKTPMKVARKLGERRLNPVSTKREREGRSLYDIRKGKRILPSTLKFGRKERRRNLLGDRGNPSNKKIGKRILNHFLLGRERNLYFHNSFHSSVRKK